MEISRDLKLLLNCTKKELRNKLDSCLSQRVSYVNNYTADTNMNHLHIKGSGKIKQDIYRNLEERISKREDQDYHSSQTLYKDN